MNPNPLAWAIFTDEGLIRIWSTARTDLAGVAEATGKEPIPLYAAPVEQAAAQDEQYPPCDYCGVVPEHHPWHGSGIFNGEDNPHIHACNQCRHLLPPHPEQKPAAWMYRGTDMGDQLSFQCLNHYWRPQFGGTEHEYIKGIPLYAAPTLQAKQSNAANDVLAERHRQIEAEDMTTASDDSYHAAELPRAAAAYILNGANDEAPSIWPWARSWWKPRDARANYVRAAALLLAEIERIDRQQTGSPEGLLRSAQGGAE